MNKKSSNINWDEMIAQYQESGIGLDKWCAQNNVPASTMKYYIYKKKKEMSGDTKDETAPAFIEVKLNDVPLVKSEILIHFGKLEMLVNEDNIDIASQLIRKVIYD